MSLQLVTRIQYTFQVTNKKLSKLLTLNVKAKNNPHAVNIVAMFSVVTCESSKKVLVKIVVGTDDPNNSKRGGAGDPLNPDLQRTNKLQNKQFRINMRQLGIKYTENEVIQIFNVESVTGTPGIFRIYYSALTCANIPILAFYIGERALLFPLENCTCVQSDGQILTKFNDEVLSAFIQVSREQLKAAIKVLRRLKFPTSATSTFDETQLCININNIVAESLPKNNENS